jgi:hypothetical protein
MAPWSAWPSQCIGEKTARDSLRAASPSPTTPDCVLEDVRCSSLRPPPSRPPSRAPG